MAIYIVSILSVLYILFLSACAIAPDPNNDPRTGGLFGGVKGIINGDYELRIKQERESLVGLRSFQEQLKSEGSALETTRRLRDEGVKEQQRELDELREDNKRLSADVDAITAVCRTEKLKVSELRQKLSSLEANIRTTQDALGTEQLTYEQLEARLAKLREEHKRLIDQFVSR
jgi:chromosome segregation ATPase